MARNGHHYYPPPSWVHCSLFGADLAPFKGGGGGGQVNSMSRVVIPPSKLHALGLKASLSLLAGKWTPPKQSAATASNGTDIPLSNCPRPRTDLDHQAHNRDTALNMDCCTVTD